MAGKYVVYVWQFMTPPEEFAARAHLPQKRVVLETYATEAEAVESVKALRLEGQNAHFEHVEGDLAEEVE